MASDFEEEALCRICRSGQEEDQALFHPCKCSGSIMYTHQDCLLEWLKHSKKKHCELCGYPFVFRRKYKSNMPQGSLPIHHYLRMMFSKTVSYFLLGLRAIMVATCWLGILPLVNIYVWRTYFRFVDMIAFFVYDSQPPHSLVVKSGNATTSTSTLGSKLVANATQIVSAVLEKDSNSSSIVAAPTTVATTLNSNGPQIRLGLPNGVLSWAQRFGSSRTGRILNSIMKDCFEGQILTCSIVILFISIFLLREWILQNIPQPPPPPAAAAAGEQAPPLQDRAAREAALRALQQAAVAQAAAQEAAQLQLDRQNEGLEDLGERDHQGTSDGSASPAERPLRPLPARTQARTSTEPTQTQDSNKTIRELRLAHFEKNSGGEGSSKSRADPEAEFEGSMSFSTRAEGKGKEKEEENNMNGVGYFGDELPNYGTEALNAMENVGSSSKPIDSNLSPAVPSTASSPTSSFKLNLDQPHAFSTLLPTRDVNHSPTNSRNHSPTSKRSRVSSRSSSRRSSPQNQSRATSEPLSAEGLTPSPVVPNGFKFDFLAPQEPSGNNSQSRRSDRATSTPLNENPSSPSTPFRFKYTPPSPSIPLPPEDREKSITPMPEEQFWKSLERKDRKINDGPVVDLDEQPSRPFSDSIATQIQQGIQDLDVGSPSSHNATTTEDKGKGKAFDDPIVSPVEAAAASSSQAVDESRTSYERNHMDRSSLNGDGENNIHETSSSVLASTPPQPATSSVLGDSSYGPDLDIHDFDTPVESEDQDEGDDDAWEDEEEEGGEIEDEDDDDDIELVEVVEEDEEDADEIQEWEQAEAAADEADVEGEGIREELEGIFEAVGMRGPILGIFSNVALICTLCSLFLLVFVALPYLVGKLCGPVEIFQAMTFPIQLIRFFTDPMFEGIFKVVKFLLRPLFKLVIKSGIPNQVASLLSSVTERSQSSSSMGISSLPSLSSLSSLSVISEIVDVGKSTLVSAKARIPAWLPAPKSSSSPPFDLKVLFGHVKELPRLIVNTFRALDAKRFGKHWTDRMFCVALGHAFFAFYLTLHTNLAKWAGYTHMNWTQSWMKQQYLVSKVLFFIVVELVLFPLCCGYLLNLCVYPLLSNEVPSIFQWLTISGVFALWLCGTLYMFLFAQFVGTTRKALRAGALCFIRDPQDPSYHPVKEILERSALLQLRKIGTSAIMYAMICFSVFGFNVHGVRLLLNGVLPLRWKPYEPISDVPYDLLVLAIVLPYVVARARPDHAFRSLCREFWINIARRLRLTSYLIGGRPEEEEGYYASDNWKEWFKFSFRRAFGSNSSGTIPEDLSARFVRDGGLARVPGDDHNTLYGPIVIPVDSSGAPTTEEGVTALQKQLDAIAKAARSTPPKYTIIYTPPHFRRRIIILLGLLWLHLSIGIIATIVLPLSIGRFCFSLVGLHELHDTYPFTVGLLLLWMANRFRKTVVRSIAFLKRNRSHPRFAVKVLARFAKSTVRYLKISYLSISFAIVIPILLGLTLYQYVIAPFRFVDYQVPEVSLAQLWALGIIFEALIFRALPARDQMGQHLQQIYNNGLRRPEIGQASRKVIFPSVLGLVSLICLPGLFVWAGMAFVQPEGRSAPLDQIWLRTAHLFIISTAIFCKLTMVLVHRMSTWTQSLRDELFLESTELRNYSALSDESEQSSVTTTTPQTAQDEIDGPVPDVLLQAR